jgi:hypothetical protein
LQRELRFKGIRNRLDQAEINQENLLVGRARSAIMKSCRPSMEILCQSWMTG